MRVLAKWLPVGLNMAVGAVALVMAGKNLFATRLLPFQERAAGVSWEDLDRGLQHVIQALMRVSGSGFLAVGLLLFLSPITMMIPGSKLVRCAIPAIGIVYGSGLWVANILLWSKTSSKTPWKGSLGGVGLLSASFVLSLIR